MKNKIVFAFILASLIPLCACHFSNDESSYNFASLIFVPQIPKLDPSDMATRTVECTFNNSPMQIEVEKDVKKIVISDVSGIAGKGVFLARVNNSYRSSIPTSYLRYVTDTSGINNATNAYVMDAPLQGDSAVLQDSYGTGCFTPYLENYFPEIDVPAYDSASGLDLLQADASALNIGSTRSFYVVRTEDGVQNTVRRKFKILAIDHSSKIIIWGRDSSDGEVYTVSEQDFETAAISIDGCSSWPEYYLKKFKDIYHLDKAAYGDEAEVSGSDLYGYMNLIFFGMGLYGMGSTRGYFWSSDYKGMNRAKCLYINTLPATSTDQGSRVYPEDTYELITATMAHEFMHMIQYNQKVIKQGITCTTAFGEMMGELAKDMIISYLAPSKSQSVWTRFLDFNAAYYAVGITGSAQSAIYYATNYAFGAWLCRNFGGIKLARNFIQNSYNSDEAIVHAVNSINGTSYTMNDLIKLFVTAVTVDDSNYAYRLNKASAPQNEILCSGSNLSSGQDYNFPFLPINIFSLASTVEWSPVTSRVENHGPYLCTAFTQWTRELPPYHGLQLCKIGTVQSDASSIEIEFSGSYSDVLQMYVIIGDNRVEIIQ